MDYHQTRERYRKREMRRDLAWLLRLLIFGGVLWFGWYFGKLESADVIAENATSLEDQLRENDRLQQQLTSLRNDLREEQNLRREAELMAGAKNKDEPIDRLTAIIARYLARGIDAEQIKMALQAVGRPARCRELESRDMAVATGFFAGQESKQNFFNGGLRLYAEGEAGKEASRDMPWYDPAAPVSIRLSFLGGEKTIDGVLPMETVLIADRWLLKLQFTETQIQGYMQVALSQCTIPERR